MSQYNTESVDGIYLERANYAALNAAGPGAFTYTYNDAGEVVGMIHVLPAAGLGHIPIRPNCGPADHSWNWDGNLEQPTLSPSIHAVPREPSGDDPGRVGWHGYCRAGRFESV